MRRLLMCVRTSPDGERESEPVVVEANELEVFLTLDDGVEIRFARGDLAVVLTDPEARAA